MLSQRNIKTRLACAFCAAAFLFGLWAPARGSFLFWGRETENPLKKGRELYALGRYAEAEREFSSGLAGLDTAASKKAYWFIGSCYEKEGKLDHALANYQLAVRIYPKDTQLLLALGRLYLKIGLFDRATTIFSTMLRMDSDNFEANVGIAEVYANEGFLSKAAQHYKTALESMTVRDLQLWRAYASTLLEQRQYGQAREVMEHTLSIDPNDPDSLLLSARLYYETGLHTSALAVITQAAALAPSRNDIVLRRALWLVSAGQADQGLGIALSALERDAQEPLALLTAGLALLEKGDSANARQYLDRAVALQDTAPFIAKTARGLLDEAARTTRPAR